MPKRLPSHAKFSIRTHSQHNHEFAVKRGIYNQSAPCFSKTLQKLLSFLCFTVGGRWQSTQTPFQSCYEVALACWLHFYRGMGRIVFLLRFKRENAFKLWPCFVIPWNMSMQLARAVFARMNWKVTRCFDSEKCGVRSDLRVSSCRKNATCLACSENTAPRFFSWLLEPWVPWRVILAKWAMKACDMLQLPQWKI